MWHQPQINQPQINHKCISVVTDNHSFCHILFPNTSCMVIFKGQYGLWLSVKKKTSRVRVMYLRCPHPFSNVSQDFFLFLKMLFPYHPVGHDGTFSLLVSFFLLKSWHVLTFFGFGNPRIIWSPILHIYVFCIRWD